MKSNFFELLKVDFYLPVNTDFELKLKSRGILVALFEIILAETLTKNLQLRYIILYIIKTHPKNIAVNIKAQVVNSSFVSKRN